MMRSSSICPKCGNDKANCRCPRGSAGDSTENSNSESTQKKDIVPQTVLDNAKVLAPKAAVEILVFKPDPAKAYDQRGVHENLWIKSVLINMYQLAYI